MEKAAGKLTAVAEMPSRRNADDRVSNKIHSTYCGENAFSNGTLQFSRKLTTEPRDFLWKGHQRLTYSF
jgi:hypothetical protein